MPAKSLSWFGERCTTMMTAACRSAGRHAVIALSALRPPAEAPTRMMSERAERPTVPLILQGHVARGVGATYPDPACVNTKTRETSACRYSLSRSTKRLQEVALDPI